MELKEFIKQSLIDICEGIQEAREKIDGAPNSSDRIIAPEIPNDRKYEKIKFDIAVTVTKTASGTAAGEAKTSSMLEVLGMRASLDGEISSEQIKGNTSRICFEVPFSPRDLHKQKN